MEEYRILDGKFIDHCKKNFANPIGQDFDCKRLLIDINSIVDKTYHDLNLLDSTTDKDLTKMDVPFQLQLPPLPGQPSPHEVIRAAIYEQIPAGDVANNDSDSLSNKRNLKTAQETDSEGSASGKSESSKQSRK